MPIFASLLKKKKPSPAVILQETKVGLLDWIADAQAQLQTPVEPEEYPYWRLEAQDDITSSTAQLAVVEWLEDHPEAWTAPALEDQLRQRFRRLDEIEVLLSALPCFDEDEDELDYSTMDQVEQEQRQKVRTLHAEQFLLDRQCDLLACLLGISARRLHDVRHILNSYYYDEELRKSTQTTEAAECYPQIKAWIEGTATLQNLPIPAFSAGMTEYPPRFPKLI